MSAREPGLIVIKLGGRALEGDGAACGLADDLRRLRHPFVLVHGGGAEVSRWCERLGLPQRFEGGRRVTDRRTRDVVVAVLAGLANKRLVASLRGAGWDAVGLAALDGGIVEAELHPEHGRLGEVARVRDVNPYLLELLLAQGRVPVLASVAAVGERMLNLNADDLAGALAAGLQAEALVLLTDVDGVMLDGAVAPRLTLPEAASALARGQVEGGMSAKLHAAALAVVAGVPRAHVAAWRGPGFLSSLLAGSGEGTTIEPAPADVHV